MPFMDQQLKGSRSSRFGVELVPERVKHMRPTTTAKLPPQLPLVGQTPTEAALNDVTILRPENRAPARC